MTIAALSATTVNIIKQVRNQAIIEQHNAEIAQKNQFNAEMAAKGEKLRQGVINENDTIQAGVKATDDTRLGTSWAAGHENAAVRYDYSGNWGSKIEDKLFHQTMTGTVDDNTLKQFISEGLPAIKKYAEAHAEYEYQPLTRLQDGGIDAISQYNSAMQQLVKNAIQTGKITSEAVGEIHLSPTYIETMIPLVLAGKAATSKEYRKAEQKAARKEKREEKRNNGFFKSLKNNEQNNEITRLNVPSGEIHENDKIDYKKSKTKEDEGEVIDI